MSKQGFSGFPEEGLQFLADLADNIVAPAVAFVQTVGEQLQFISPGIRFDTRINGQGSMLRIYRDIRFSKCPPQNGNTLRRSQGHRQVDTATRSALKN